MAENKNDEEKDLIDEGIGARFSWESWDKIDEDSVLQYDEFVENSYKKGTGYQCPHFPMFNEKMEGLDEGLYMFAGESNHGKTALIQNLFWDYVSNPDNNLFGLYFTLDDTANDLIPRLVAMNQNIPIGVTAKPQRYEIADDDIDVDDMIRAEYAQYLMKRDEGIQQLKDMSRRFKIFDGNSVTCGEEILEICKCVKAAVKMWDYDMDIIVAIDSLSDITFKKKQFNTDKELNDYIARQVKHWAVDILKCPIFGSLHLRKIDQNRRPTIADVKESGRYAYEASFLGLVYNDVARNKQAARIAVNTESSEEFTPVIELDWAKNKKSSFKGTTYQVFTPNTSKCIECDPIVTERFNRLIYSI